MGYETCETLSLLLELIPKAFIGFLFQNDGFKIIGFIHSMSCSDPSNDVRIKSSSILHNVLGLNNKDEEFLYKYKEKILCYVIFVLKNIHRPSHVPLLTSVSSNSNNTPITTATTNNNDT